MLTVIGQNEKISYKLRINKDQQRSIQKNDHGYHFNNRLLIYAISIFADTPERIQTLLDVVKSRHDMECLYINQCKAKRCFCW